MKTMTPRDINNHFWEAIVKGGIFPYYQPQFNHTTHKIIGAEALMRWKPPGFDMQSPTGFIPVLEESGLIHEADLFVFEQICDFLRRSMDNGIPVVPISFNMSRYDYYQHDYVSEIEEIRKKYDIPVELLRAEITESSAVGGTALMSSVIQKLHDCNYYVEMDDFGAGYSSLNALKDLPVDAIKMDMNFLSGDINGRGGSVIKAVVQMAKWMSVSIIAEGVETIEQADFMQSIGCNYIQGYLYSRPLTENAYIELLARSKTGKMQPQMEFSVDALNFWNPESYETLIFSQYVGPAAIFSYENGMIEIQRVNKKYLNELGINISEEDIVRTDPWVHQSDDSRREYEEAIHRAIISGDEEECETWRRFASDCCGDEAVCIRSSIQLIGKSGDQAVFYARIRNITSEKRRYIDLSESEKRFRFASEQANVYAWEYDITTKEMRPCFRCMRDLGLPPLVRNYPEPAIDAGIFPQDYADMYREWHKQLEKGIDHIEGIIPLTVGRVPFHVRYTTEFDNSGKPIKAYGSATLVVDR